MAEQTFLPRRSWIIWSTAIIALGLVLGITDDEAYYWVLGQRPALGYAYHPPAIGWSIWLSDVTIGPILRAAFGDTYWTRVWVTRAPALALMMCSLRLILGFLRSIAPTPRGGRSFAFFLAFPGVFATCWMMVPDLPLILGWCLLFVGTYALMMASEPPSRKVIGQIGLGSALLLWGKFSGILATGSAFFCLLYFSPKFRWRGIAAMTAGTVLGLIPILIWNSQHDWMSIRYQFLERHQGGGISWLRWARFMLIQLVAAGPLLFCMPALIFKSTLPRKVRDYFLFWFAPPALVFFAQPLYADFKPHWALIAWWPLAIAMALLWKEKAVVAPWFSRLVRIQAAWTVVLTLIVWSSLLFPWVSRVGVHFKGADFNPTLDIGNDLKAWSGLAEKWRTELTVEEQRLPVAGSRYQTASQAAFALDGIAVAKNQVGLIPRGIKSKDEWPDLPVSQIDTPEYGEWGKLNSPLLFVADNRYSSPPEFRKAKCVVRFKHAYEILGLPVKQLVIYRCDPES